MISSETFYRMVVPPGATDLRISTSGGSGDLDLFIRRGQVPACQVQTIDRRFAGLGAIKLLSGVSGGCGDASARSLAFFTNSETVTIPAPAPGDWYIDLSAAAAYSGVTLRASLNAPPTLAASATELPFAAVEGRSAPGAQSFSLVNSAGGPFNWTAQARTTSGGDWLRLSQTSGAGEATVGVTVNLTGLMPATYRGSIVVTAATLAGSPLTINVTLTLAARPILLITSTALVPGGGGLRFTALPGQNPAVQSLAISNGGGSTLEWTATASTTRGGAWLSVTPDRGAGNATLQVSVGASSLAPGAYEGSLIITAPGAANSPATIAVALTVGLPVLLSSEGIVNASSYLPNRSLTVNEITSLFGSNFIDPCSVVAGSPNPCPRATGFPLPTQLGPTRVTINGIAAPLLLVTPNQINLVTPFGLTGSTATVVVSRGSISSAPATLPLSEQALGIFTVLSNGSGAAILLHADGRLVSRAAPLEADEIVVLFVTGLGAVFPAIPTGQPAPSDPLSRAVPPLRMFLDGGEGEILFAGPVPGFAGLYQVNIRVPSFLGRRFPVVRIQNSPRFSNDTSAGGPSLLDVTPAQARAAGDLTVTLRGVNLPPRSALRIGGEEVPAVLVDGPLQILVATIPGRLLSQPGELAITVVDPTAPEEAPSNPLRVTLTR